MQSHTDTLRVSDAPEAHRFEIHSNGTLAGFAQYRTLDGALLFTHTEVLPGFQGQGVASQLARGALDAVRARGLQAVPRCRFIAEYIRKHPAYADLVRQARGEA